MKKLVFTFVISLLVAGWSIARAQEFPEEYLGLPGDNLNLYAVMKLFQESETLEGFERKLNDENSRVNNLDLNGDNLVDYLMVVDYADGNVHTIVVRAALGKNETQDVAVFTVQRFRDESVQIQLVGDEALYGKNYIIEPIYAEGVETPNPGYIGTPVRNQKVRVVSTTTYEVASWPVIAYIYRPSYVVWRSSWNWGYYPAYWNPWRPFYWHTYYGYHYHWHNHYYAYYRPWHQHRHPHYKTVYYTRVRTYSPTVVVNINKGTYRNTYTRPDLKSEGERLYARTNPTRSSATTSARVRTSGSTAVNKSAGVSASASERRSSSVATGRNTSAAQPQATTSRRSSSGTDRVIQGTETQRKSATIASDRNSRTSSSGNAAPSVRSSAPASSAGTAARPSVERSTNSVRKPAATSEVKRTPAPAVNKNSSLKPSVNSSGRTATPTVRQPATQRPAANVSGRSVTKSQSVPKAAPARSSTRPAKAVVSSPRTSNRSSAVSPSQSGNRTESTRSSRRR